MPNHVATDPRGPGAWRDAPPHLEALERSIRGQVSGLLEMIDILDEANLTEAQRRFVRAARASCRSIAETAALLLDPDEPATETPTASDREPAAAGRILVAEDDAACRTFIVSVLEKAGYDVVAVETGAQALVEISRTPVDLVLTDIDMPVMDGLEASRRIRAFPSAAAEVPIVAVTGNLAPDTIDAMRRVGVGDYLAKPVRGELLLGTVRRWLSGGVGEKEEPPVEGTDPMIDRTILEALEADTGRDLLPELIDTFVVHAEERVARVTRALPDGRIDDIAAESHALRSSAATFGAEEVRRLSADIEDHCKQGNHDALPSLVADLDTAMRQSKAAFEAYVADL